MEGQPISVEALERPVEENRPPSNPVEGAGTGLMWCSILQTRVSQAYKVAMHANHSWVLILQELFSVYLCDACDEHDLCHMSRQTYRMKHGAHTAPH